MKKFNIIIVGKGLVGSAAAKYLGEFNKGIAIIGPNEPVGNDKAAVYSSHYDQARVQRLIGKDKIWTALNILSVDRYSTITKQSGINFHTPVGCLYVNPNGPDDYLNDSASVAGHFKLNHFSYVEPGLLKKDFGELVFPHEAAGLLERGPAGFINPKALIAAQLNIFSQNGGNIFTDTVKSITHIGEGFRVSTIEGNDYLAEKVVVAAGAFVNYLELINRKLDLKIKSEVVLLAEVSPSNALKLKNLPSLLYEINNKDLEGIYLIQPVKYPDGRFYLKMGSNLPEDIFFDDLAQVQDWFRSGKSDVHLDRLKNALFVILPEVEFLSFQTKRCVINRSRHGRPYIGETGRKGLFVISGCNGYSAMCSDGIGNIAAHLVREAVFPGSFRAEDFEILYSD